MIYVDVNVLQYWLTSGLNFGGNAVLVEKSETSYWQGCSV